MTNSIFSSRSRQYIPLILAILVTGAYLIFFEFGLLKSTGNILIYPLDDPYIHMQVARNLAIHGVWGIHPADFGSASSSVLYTLLLAISFKLFGIHALTAFIINCVAGIVLLFVLHRWLLQQQVNLKWRCIFLLAIVFFAPLPILVIIGMEHTLQCLFCFLFLCAASDFLSHDKFQLQSSKSRLPWQLLLYGVLVTAIRFEGLFLVVIVCGILLCYRRLGSTVLLGLVSALPVILFGIYSIRHGSYFLPNSVLLKSESIPLTISGIVLFLKNIIIYKLSIISMPIAYSEPLQYSLIATLRLLILLPVIYLLFLNHMKRSNAYTWFIFILSACVLMHLSLASTGWFYRYEAYLIVCSAMLILLVAYRYGAEIWKNKNWISRAMMALLCFALVFPFFLRSISAYAQVRRACVNVYEQQYQSARFLQTFYNNDVIAANDIGAIAFYTDIKVVDLWGLANIEVARSKKGNYCTPGFLDSLVKREHVKLAIVFDDWFDRTLLDRWSKVASMKISNNVINGSSVISIYAINEMDKQLISNNLKAFQRSMPASIQVNYY